MDEFPVYRATKRSSFDCCAVLCFKKILCFKHENRSQMSHLATFTIYASLYIYFPKYSTQTDPQSRLKHTVSQHFFINVLLISARPNSYCSLSFCLIICKGQSRNYYFIVFNQTVEEKSSPRQSMS